MDRLCPFFPPAARVFIDGKLIMDSWVVNTAQVRSAWLTCGTKAIEIWYYASTTAGATIGLQWEATMMPKTVRAEFPRLPPHQACSSA